MSSILTVNDFDPNGAFARLLLPVRFRKRVSETRFKQEWRLTKAQYAQMLAERFNLRTRKYQRGSIILSGLGIQMGGGGPPAGNVVLSDHTGGGAFEDTTPSGTAGCAASFENDGQLWERNDIEVDVEQAGEWWDNEPVADVGDFFEVRALSAGKSGTWSSAAASDDAWITITATRQWKVERGSPNGSKSCTATFEVGPDGDETADDSAAITCRAEYNDL